MPFQPQTAEQHRQRAIEELKSNIDGLTSFSPGDPERGIPADPEWDIVNYFAQEWEFYGHVALSSQLSGWVDYAGGPVEVDDLLDLRLDPSKINLELLNALMFDEDLDALAAQDSIERIPGSTAQGEVLFGTTDAIITIPAGTLLETSSVETDAGLQSLRFRTVNTVTAAAGEGQVRARVEAVETGDEYNVGEGTITQIRDNPGGVEGVTNPNPTSGGEGPETNEELRERIKNSATDTSGGGTAAGLEGAVVDGIDGIEADDVESIEYTAPVDDDYLANTVGVQRTDSLSTVSAPSTADLVVTTGTGDEPRGLYIYDGSTSDWLGPFTESPHIDVVVDGGLDTDVEEIIDDAKPVGIAAQLVRPTALTVSVDISVLARHDIEDIDTERIGDQITAYLSDLGIGEDVYHAQLIEHIMDTDEDVINVDGLTVTVDGADVTGDVSVAPDEVARASEVTVTTSGAGGT